MGDASGVWGVCDAALIKSIATLSDWFDIKDWSYASDPSVLPQPDNKKQNKTLPKYKETLDNGSPSSIFACVIN